MKFLKDYIAQGTLGEIFSASVIGAGSNWGTTLPSESLAYLVDPKNGATMLHIPFAHTLNGLEFCLGSFKTFAATLKRRNNETLLTDVNKKIPQLTNDQIIVTGALENGTIVSLHYHGGESKWLNLYWEIKGSKGELIISSPTGHLQFGQLKLQAAIGEEPLTDLEIPESYRPNEGGRPGFDAEFSRCLYYAYKRIGEDIANNTSFFPDFNSAVKHHHLLELIEHSASREQALTVK